MTSRFLHLNLILVLLDCGIHGAESQPEWKAGLASVVITPEGSMWMGGYAARKKPSEGKVHDLHARALALEDTDGTRLVIVALDLIGIPRILRDSVELEVGKRHGLPPEGLLLNASHTHCGPELRAMKARLFGVPEERIEQSRNYLDGLRGTLVQLVGEALGDLAPARLAHAHGRAGFAVNRRLKTERGVLNRPNPDGPVDHDVPVLRVEGHDGTLRALMFGYACHNTTLGFYKFCADYTGFAREVLEAAHPGVMTLFLAGCGGDQNPQPRRTLDLARLHGRELAAGVERALICAARQVHGPLRVALDVVDLEFATPPDRAALERLGASTRPHDRRRAAALLDEIERNGAIRTTYPYPVQVARFGDDLTLVALAGEAVVDYSLRFKAELTETPVWVAAYSNDVFGYIPSLRVLREGGYEGGGAMQWTALPGPFAPSVERLVAGKVHELVDRVRPRPGVRHIESDAATGSSLAVVVGPVPLLHTTQVLAVGAGGEVLGDGDAARQVGEVFDGLATLLEATSSGLDRVVKLNVVVAEVAVTGLVKEALARRFRGKGKPAVSYVTSSLPIEGALVALDAVALVGGGPSSPVAAGTRSPARILPPGPRVYVAGQAARGDLRQATRDTLAGLGRTLDFVGLDRSHVIQLRAFLQPIEEAAIVHEEMARFFSGQAVPPLALVEWVSSSAIEIELIAAAPHTPAPGGGTGPAIEFLTPPGMKASAVFSRVTRLFHPETIYVSGIECTSVGADAATQIHDVFAVLREAVERSGGDLEHLAKATYYVSDREVSLALNRLRPEYYNPVRPPAASKAVVRGVGREGRTVSMDMIAVPAGRGARRTPPPTASSRIRRER